MRIRRRQPHRRPYKDLTHQSESEALANFKEFLQEYWFALSQGRRQDVVNRFVLMEMTADHCQEAFGRAPELPVIPDDYRQELADSLRGACLAAAEAGGRQATRPSGERLNAFLGDLQQRARAAGITGRASPEEKASYKNLYTQIYGPPYDRRDILAADVGLLLQHTPLWAIYRSIGYYLEGITPDERAAVITHCAEVPTESAMERTLADLAAVHLKMMTDLLRLTDGWDTTARRSATLAQLGLPQPEPPPRAEPELAGPRGTA